MDSGGAGEFRGGLGQATAMRNLSGREWEISAMIDRVRFPGQGLEGGQPGAVGEMLVDGRAMPAKSLTGLAPEARVELNLPGGGGYGRAFARPVERVLDDVVKGYVSVEAAAREYGVVVRYTGAEEQMVRLPRHYAVDEEATRALRSG